MLSPDAIITDNRSSVPTILPGSVPNCITFKLNAVRNVPVVYLDYSSPTASSVVDNEIDIADNMRPTLSSILPDFEKAGMLAVETLRKLMASRRTPLRPLHVSYGVKALVEHGSTQDTHGAGRLVDAARSIIIQRSHEGLRVADIARELNVSNRLLELHFRAVLGHSVRDELIDYHLDEVKRRLARGNEPIESIAMQCGWRTPIDLKILFRKRLGMSMRDFRKQATGH